MTHSRSKAGRFRDNMRRNVLSYKYLRHNILMTALVVVMALGVFAVVSFGEKADPLADELYAGGAGAVSTEMAAVEAVTEAATDAAETRDSVISPNDTVRVAGSMADASSEEAAKEEPASEEDASGFVGKETSGTATILYDGVEIMREASEDAAVAGTVDNGVVFDLIAVGDSWVCIRMFDGGTGYVSADYVSLDTGEN